MKVRRRLLSLLLCFCFLLSFIGFSAVSVNAASSTEYRFLTSPDQIMRMRLTDTRDGTYIDIFNPSIADSSGGASYFVTYNLGLTSVDPDNILVEIVPNNDFIYNLDPSKHYTFIFEVANQNSLSGSADAVKMAMRDTDGNYAEASGTLYSSTANTQFFSVTFTPAQINRISNITSIQIQYRLAANATSHIGVYVFKDCTVTVENPDTEQIAGIIENSTGQVINKIEQSTGQITDKIEEGTDKITGEIEESTDEITGSIEENTDEVTGAIDEQTEKQKGFFEKLADDILNGLKGLFIPGDVVDPETGEKVSYFTAYFDDWNRWMDDHFGVLYFPFSVLFDLLDKILSFSPPSNPTINFPGLTIMGQELIEPINYDFSVIPIPWLQTVHDLYLFAVDAIVGFWLVKLAYKKLHEIMGGGS